MEYTSKGAQLLKSVIDRQIANSAEVIVEQTYVEQYTAALRKLDRIHREQAELNASEREQLEIVRRLFNAR